MRFALRPAACLMLVAAVCAAWLPALGASFQFDDFNVIVRDARVQSFGAWAASMPGMRPLLKLSYALNHELGGGVPAFRAVNIAIHALNALLVLLLLERLSRRHGLEARAAFGVAFAAALVFALHPVQTEAVTYISGRSSALVASFCLAAMLAWLRAVDRRVARSHGVATVSASPGLRWWAALFAALALGAKEAAAVLPLALILWAATMPAGVTATASASPCSRGSGSPVKSEPASGSSNRRAAMLHASWPSLFVFVAAALALVLLAPYRELIAASLDRRGFGQNLLAQSEAIPWLVGQIFRPGGMNADPDLRVPQALTLTAGLRLFMLAAVIGGALAARRRHPAAAFGVLWFFVWLLPTHSLLPREDLANDRQLYFALVGPAWLAAYGGWRVVQGLHARLSSRFVNAAVAALIFGLAITLGLATLERNRVYVNEVSFWEDAARRSPRKARTANNLGYAYALACRDAEALAEFARAAQLDPRDSRSRVNRRLLEQGALFRDGERDCR